MDWVNNFIPAQSDGTLPLDGVAGAMRYKRAIIWEVDLHGFGIGGRSLKGEWTLSIESPTGTVLFHQTVEMELFFVYLNMPGLAFFTWNILKDNAATTATDIIDGQEVEPAQMKDYLMTGLLQSNMIPASGQGSTNLTATIVTDWYSPGYQFPTGIPPGSKVKTKLDTWGFGPASVEYSWAFGPGGQVLDTFFHPHTGQTFLLHVDDGTLKVARTRRAQPRLQLDKPDTQNETDDEAQQALRCDYQGLVGPRQLNPRFARLYHKDGALYCVSLADTLQLFRSESDAKDWKELSVMPVEQTTADALNISVSACAFASDGSLLYLYGATTHDEPANNLKSGQPMYVELKNQGSNWIISARGAVRDGDQPASPQTPPGNDGEGNQETVNNLPVNDIAGLEYIDGRLHMVAKTGGNSMSLYVSSDGLRSLNRLQIS